MGALAREAVGILETADAAAKARRTRAVAAAWRAGAIAAIGTAPVPDRPARPARPELKRPTEVPKRKINRGTAGRGALLHALAHIELNAIDLAADILARFTGEQLPRGFYDDWLTVADEEGKHYLLLPERLEALGFAYGDLPAHDGLWQAAEETAYDLLARLAVVPLVLEARGLDVTPMMIGKLRKAEDHDSAAVLRVIYQEEVGHVAIGKRWFDWLCRERGLAPQETWQALVRRHFRGRLKPPFNDAARAEAGLPADFYEVLAVE